MARVPVDTRMGVEFLQPQAAPVDTYVQPGPSPLRDFADSLAKLDRPLQQFLDARAKKQADEDRIRGEAAFYEDNSSDIAELVRTGKVPAQYSPAFVKGFKNAQGGVVGRQLRSDFNAAFDAWDGKNSDDPKAFDDFMGNFIREHVTSQDPEVLRGLMPHVRQLGEEGYNRYEDYRHKQTVQGSLDAHVAAANQDIDELNREGLSTEEGTNYPVVFQKIEEKRAAFVASGGDPDAFDKTMMDAMSAKVLATRDPGLLGWFDQKVPGKDYTYGESPYGAKVKLETTNSLEVIARRSASEDAQKQTAIDKARKDDAHRAAIEFLSDPANISKPVPDGILRQGEVDPEFKVHIEEWRKTLGQGFSDPSKIKDVYGMILDGGGYKAVTDAFRNGVFGRPEDLQAAYAFAKSYEDNKDRITATVTSPTADRFMKDLDIRTKGVNPMTLDPITGTSNEGYEAQYDFKRLLSDWVVRNPNATPQETEEAITKIGKGIMDRLVAPEDGDPSEPSTYERPNNLGFDNPFTAGTGVAPTSTHEQPAPEPTTPGEEQEQKGEIEDLMNGMTPEQKASIEGRAKALGLTPEEFTKQYLLTTPPGKGDQKTDATAPDGTPVQNASFRPNEARQQDFTVQEAQNFIETAMAQGGDSGVSVVARAPDTQTAHLLDLIGKHEARGNYNAVYGDANATRDLGQLSVNQILAEQVIARRRGAASTAIGKYQFIYKTLRRLKSEMGLSGNEKFTPRLQDALALRLLQERGLDDFKAGRKSARSFALGLSQEWASLPDPSTGRSYYAGDGLNRSSVSRSRVYAALGLVQQASFSPTDQPASSTPVSDAYSDIPDVDGSGNAGQRAKFAQWNSDPIANNAANLAQLEPTLADVIKRAQNYTNVQFVVGSGKRDKALQSKAVQWGWSKTQDSDHLHGDAADLWPIINGKVKFDSKAQASVVKAMKRAAKEMGVELDVGAEWKRFKDIPHFGLKHTTST